MSVGFNPGVYRHYKGALYYAMFLTEDSNNRTITHSDHTETFQSTQEPEVIYIALEGPKAGQRCNRKLSQWNEKVKIWDTQMRASEPVYVPRFEWVRP
jgi:hypothetical protein